MYDASSSWGQMAATAIIRAERQPGTYLYRPTINSYKHFNTNTSDRLTRLISTFKLSLCIELYHD